ncbi:FAD:protein FMN transferase [soil metagenome]
MKLFSIILIAAFLILFHLKPLKVDGKISPQTSRINNSENIILKATQHGVKADTTNHEMNRFTYTEYKMGTYFKIILYASDENMANLAAKEAYEKMDELNLIFSDYVEESEINNLSLSSGKNEFISTSKPLYEVISKSLLISKVSNGAFDITVGPYVKLWRRAIRQQKLPSLEAIGRAKAAVGFDKINLSKNSGDIKLLVPGMQLDVGGIAKGYILNEAMKVLKLSGINSALLDGGGDILVSNAPPDKEGWIMELNTGYGQQQNIIKLHNASVATSGDNYRFVEFEGKRYSHIIDPHTGFGLVDQYTVSVIAKDGATADALASAISVLGPEKGIKMIDNFRGAATFIFSDERNENKTWQSGNFQKFLLTESAFIE